MKITIPIPDALRRIAKKLMPTRYIELRTSRSEPQVESTTITADEIHDILREAENGSTRRLFALYRDILFDAHLQSQFSTRKLALLGDACLFQAFRQKDVADQKAALFCKDAWADTPSKREALTHLLDSCLWPVAVVRKWFKPSEEPGRRFDIDYLEPIPHHFLDFSTGRLRIYDTDPHTGHPLSTSHEPDASRYIVHRGHLLTSLPDNWGGPMRAALFWWMFKTFSRDWWARFLERFGSPFIVGKYDSADDRGRGELAAAFSAATRLFGLVISKETDAQIHSVNTQGHGDAFSAFHDYANKELSKLIIGQTMTSDAQAAGLGSGQAEVQERVRGDIRQFDAASLGETMRDQLWAQYMQINGIPGRPPAVGWGQEDQPADVAGDMISALATAGIEVTDDGLQILGNRLGLPLRRISAGAMPSAPGDPAKSVSQQTEAAVEVATKAASLNGAQVDDSPLALSAAVPPSRAVAARDANDAVSEAAGADLARAWRGAYAPVARAIQTSTSAADLESRLAGLYDGWEPERLAALTEQALVAYAANAAAR